MTHMVSITLEDEVYYDDKVVKLRQERKLSEKINQLLRTHLEIIKKGVPAELNGIEEELQSINARKALLQEKKKAYEETKKKEEGRWTSIHDPSYRPGN